MRSHDPRLEPFSIPQQKWLILSYFTNVPGLACSYHLDGRLPHFLDAQQSITLLSGPVGKKWRSYAHHRVPCLAPSGVIFEVRQWFARSWPHPWAKLIRSLLLLPLMPLYALEKFFMDLDSEWSWFLLASLRGYFIARRIKPDVIYSTGGPASAHVAAALVAAWTKTPWIAEFQDPIVVDNAFRRNHRSRQVYRWVEKLICQRANKVIFLTQKALDRSTERTRAMGKGCVVYAGAEAFSQQHPLPQYRRSENCIVAHFGSLGGSRNLKNLLKALTNLYEKQKNSDSHLPLERLRILNYGRMDRAADQDIQRFRHTANVMNCGIISPQESQKLMHQVDVLLLIQNIDTFSQETIPSKFYEYLLTRRPILALLYGNPEIREWLSETEHSIADADSVAEIEACLVKILKTWQKDELTTLPPLAFAPTAQRAVEQILSWARKVRGLEKDETQTVLPNKSHQKRNEVQL